MKSAFLLPLCALIAVRVPVAAQTIPNPSFEANTFTTYPGYISGNTPITGWTAGWDERVGLNPAGGSPFADNGAVPHGSRVAFIQCVGIATTTLSTTITGLTPGRAYTLRFKANARSAYTPPTASYIIGSGAPVSFTASPSVGGSAPYYQVSGNFIATATTAPLVVRNQTSSNSDDSALLVDDFSVVLGDPWSTATWTNDATSGITTNSTWAYHFGSAASTSIAGRVVNGIATVNPSAAGKFSITSVGQVYNNDTNNLTSLSGTGSAVVAKDFIYGGNPATITLQGLTAGAGYVVTFLSAGFDAAGTRQVTFSSNGESRSVNQDQFGDNNGIRVEYAFAAATSTRVITIAQEQAGFSFHIYGLALRQTTPIAEAANYTFDSQNKRVVDADGVPVTFVEGAVINEVVDKPEAVEFRFGSSLDFELNDRVYFKGTKPVRIVVDGDVNIPAGAAVSADPVLNGGVAGGGTGAPSTPGGTGATPMTVHYQYFNNTFAVPHPLSHWEQLIAQNGHAYVLPRPGNGGAGGNAAVAATAGSKGQPGIGSGVPGATEGTRGPDQDERDWASPTPLAYGYGGAVPRLQESFPGFSRGNGVAGGTGWSNSAAAAPGGRGGIYEPTGVFGFPPVFVLYTTEWGAGGTPGGGGPWFAIGSPGGNGAKGADANHAGNGNGPPGFSGTGGLYAANNRAAPVLRGGHGGGSGGGGSGGVAGAPGGAGGGGGGGGMGAAGNPGGTGGKGGQGKFGGAGGAGGAGGEGGEGGGAFEISATGSIVIGGTLTARGSVGGNGGAGQVGFPGTAVMPGHPEYVVDTIGKAGTAGTVVGTSVAGNGGKGGDGGDGGKGGDGGEGAGGGGGAGGTIILRGSSVTFTGNTNPSAHLDVSGGASGTGGIGNATTLAGQAGAYYVIPTPSIGVSQTQFFYTINRGAIVPNANFTIQNTGPAGSTLYWEVNPQWWITPNARTGTLASGATFAQSLQLNTSVLGGGFYIFTFQVRDADPFSLTPPRYISIDITVTGPPDDHFDSIQGGTVIPAQPGVIVNGNLEVKGDTDAFRINVTQPGTLEAWTTSNFDTIGSLLDANGNTIVNGDDQFPDPNFRLVHVVTPGVYFIRVAGFNGNLTGLYTLHVNVWPGPAPFEAKMKTYGNRQHVVWDAYAGQKYRILSSPDLVRWKLDTNTLYTGIDLPKDYLVPNESRSFFRVHQGDLFPVIAASIRSSSSPPDSADLVSETAGASLTIGNPANVGDTALLNNSAPFTAGTGILIAASATNPSKNFIAQAPCPATATAPAGFPVNGHWLATSSHLPNGDNAAVNANTAWFPADAGWIGGRVVNHTETFSNFDYSSYFFDEDWGFYPDDNGNVQIEPDTNKRPTRLTQKFTSGNDPDFAELPLLQGAWLTCGANNNTQPLVTGIKPQIFQGGFFGLGFHTWKPDGTPFCTAPYNVVFIPYATPDIVAGQVGGSSGGYVIGTNNYSVSIVTTPGRYHINIPSMGPDLSKGTLLVTAYDNNPNCLMTYSYPEGGGIDITATRLPLTGAPTPSPCGFYFAYIPHDRMIFGPGQ